jgi:DNA-binding response OmpR family regulator
VSGTEFDQQLSQLRHDLRTPAGHVIGYAEMLAEDLEDEDLPDIKQGLGELKALGDHLVEVIEEQFGAARKGLADLHGEDARQELTGLAGRIRDGVDRVADSCSATQRAELAPDLEKIRSAAGLVETVLAAGLASLSANAHGAAGPEAVVESQATTAIPEVSKIAEGGDILIVDDNAANLDLLKRRVLRDGYRVHLADGGEEALSVLSSEHIDLVLLDLVMPGMDGVEVLHRLKADRKLKNVPVIMLSALDDMDRIVQCILEGAEDYLMKPVNPVLLTARIGASLEKHRLRGQHAKRLKVFISSPSDVTPERRIVRDVIRSLNAEFAGQAHLVPVLWEEEPLLASETAQTQIELPRDTDIFVGIFWARFGTPLPEEVCRPDGTRYASGTEFEFEDARAGYEECKRPDILVYRKTLEPTIPLTDREFVLRSLDQKELLEAFIRRWFTTRDGISIAAVYHAFENEAEFTELVEGHLRKLTIRHLKEANED